MRKIRYISTGVFLLLGGAFLVQNEILGYIAFICASVYGLSCLLDRIVEEENKE